MGDCDKNIDLSQAGGRFWGHTEKDENKMSKKAIHTKPNNSLGTDLNTSDPPI